MPNIFLIGDTHFGHKNILKFEAEHRPFKDIGEHDEELVRRWNSVVNEKDIVYHLGDACWTRYSLQYLGLLKGKKRLILGNHDMWPAEELLKYFERLYGYREFDGGIMSHIPLHSYQVEYRYRFNIHGHLHEHNLEDKRYINVSCEQINLTPIAYEDLKIKHDIKGRRSTT